MPITFDSFTRVNCKAPTWVMPIPGGNKMLQVTKFDEDEEKGYGYIISELDGDKVREVTRSYFDGFGMDDRPGDVIHTIRLFLEE
jgi:hypothetical protein